MAKITVFLVLFSTCYTMEINHLEEILPHINETTLLALHIDETQTCSLTVHGLPLNAEILKEIAYMGIGYTFSAPFCPNLNTRGPVPWEGGIMFIADFNQKTKVFLKWLELSQFRPSKIVIIDSGECPLVPQMAELQIPCQVFRYTMRR